MLTRTRPVSTRTSSHPQTQRRAALLLVEEKSCDSRTEPAPTGSSRAFVVGNCEIMACASQALMNTLISANGCTFGNPSPRFFSRRHRPVKKQEPKPFAARASATDDDADCNVEECAPDKEASVPRFLWLSVV